MEELEAMTDPKKTLVVATRYVVLDWIDRSLPLSLDPPLPKAEIPPGE